MTTRTVHLGSDLTAEEFLALDDEIGELIHGEIRPKPMPGPLHAQVCVWICILLARAIHRRRIYSELDLKLGDLDVLRPDICVLLSQWPKEEGPVTDPPILCVEVVSPSQTPSELLAKCERYHAFGVGFCWVIDPVARRAWQYNRGGAPLEKTDALVAEGVRLSLADVFE
jgi:Uma2 family endonuclease